MKKLLLSAFVAFACSFTPSVNADTTLLDDDITSPTYSAGSIDGVNGWTTSSMVFSGAPASVFQSNSESDSTATHALAGSATDTILEVLFVGRFRPFVQTGNPFKTSITLNDGSNDILIGTNGAATEYVTGGGVSNYNTVGANLFPTPETVGHAYHQFRLTYDQTLGTGTLFAAPDLGSIGESFGPEVEVATFNSNIDVSSLQQVTATSSSESDRIGSISIVTSAPVPEPSIVGWGMMCLVGLAARRRRR